MDESVPLASELIKKFEGFKAKAYRCPAGVWTIGWGRTSAAGAPVTASSVTTRAAEDRWLDAKVGDLCSYVRLKALNEEVGMQLQDNEVAALVSFIYNIGEGKFAASGVRRFLLKGEREKAIEAWGRWNKAGGVILAGLTRRREAELSLFTGSPLPAWNHSPV